MKKTNPILLKLYTRLENELVLRGKKINQDSSLIEYLLNIKSVERYKILDLISINGEKFSENDINQSLSFQEIRMTNKYNQYTITAIGIWNHEKLTKNLPLETILKIIDEKYFDTFTTNNPINVREKIVMFTFITLRAFSNRSFIHLKNSDTEKNILKKLIEDCYSLLLSLNLIEPKDESQSIEEVLFGKPGNEHPVSNLIRHTDQLPKKTKALYATLRDQKYFLNLLDEENPQFEEFERNLDFIVRTIFVKDIDQDEFNKVLDFMRKNYDKYFLLFFNIEEHRFNLPEYTEIIEKVFNRLIK